METEPVSPSQSFPASNGWLMPDHNRGQSHRWWVAGSVRELGPSMSKDQIAPVALRALLTAMDGLVYGKQDLALQLNPAKLAFGALVWLTGLKWWLYLFHKRPHRWFISGMWKIKRWLHKVSEICRKHSKKMWPFTDELFKSTKSVCLLTPCSHHLEHRSVF